jgi:hypothetical protein
MRLALSPLRGAAVWTLISVAICSSSPLHDTRGSRAVASRNQLKSPMDDMATNSDATKVILCKVTKYQSNLVRADRRSVIHLRTVIASRPP